MRERLAIIGAGPAGLTAALYAGRADLQPLVFLGLNPGGQIATTTEVENFPGFPDGLIGPELSARMQQQAEKFGARFTPQIVEAVDLRQQPFLLQTENVTYAADAIIIATGASPRELEVPGEREFIGRGVSYCATCDGSFFRNQDIIVVGGGDSALQEGLLLTKFASRVRIVHRRTAFRAGPVLLKRAQAHPKIELVTDTVIERINGNGKVYEAMLRKATTGARQASRVDGIFIGHHPNTDLFRGQLTMDAEGYIHVDARLHTSAAGVFAAGEVHDRWFRQAITSAGFGTMAAMEAEKYLTSMEG